jgi:uncharacterized protein (TIGR02302 family)
LALGIFLTLALFDVPAMLPSWFQALLLAALAAILAFNLVIVLRRFTPPSHESARRRIETASHMAHRPLTALEDKLAGDGGGEAAKLWQAHRARMAAAIRRLRVGRPRSFLWRRDPYYLRAALVLVLAAGIFTAGGDWHARIFRAFHPDVAFFGPATPASLDIWISPPEYTGLAPQFLTQHAGQAPVAVPIGSNVLAQVHGGSTVPDLRIDRDSQPMSRVDDNDYKGQATLTSGSLLEVTQFYRSLGAWKIAIVPDLPPTISFAKPPEASARGELRIAYDAADDYGVEGVKLLVSRPGGDAGETLSVDLPLPDQHQKNAQGSSFVDLTGNPWAGGDVRLQLVASDALGQTGSSDIIETVLPERVFLNPLARAINEQRKALLADPSSRQNVAATVGGLALNPKFYNDDIVVFLALRTASDRLMLDRDDDAVPVVAQLLWDTAVRVEDGNALSSRNDLSQAMQALQQALAQNAPQAQIEQMIGDLQRQIDRYLQALSAQTPPSGKNSSSAASGQTLTSQDFQALLDRARDLSAAGSRTQARQLLAKLQDLLENLRATGPNDMHGPQGQALNAMQDLMRRQQQLLDRSFRASRQPGGNKAANPGDAAAQEALRRALGQAAQGLADHGGGQAGMGGAGGIPLSMGRADRAMRDAVQALNQGKPDAAVNAQTDALDALQQAAQSLAQSLANGGKPGAAGNSLGAQRDPLGRLEAGEGGIGDGGDLQLGKSANDAAIEKAREILGELRRRAGEQQRPEIERDYIDRLLKEF